MDRLYTVDASVILSMHQLYTVGVSVIHCLCISYTLSMHQLYTVDVSVIHCRCISYTLSMYRLRTLVTRGEPLLPHVWVENNAARVGITHRIASG